MQPTNAAACRFIFLFERFRIVPVIAVGIITATDVIILNQKSGTDLYDLMVTAVGAGSFNITFRTTGGTTIEAPVFSFAVISGAVT